MPDVKPLLLSTGGLCWLGEVRGLTEVKAEQSQVTETTRWDSQALGLTVASGSRAGSAVNLQDSQCWTLTLREGYLIESKEKNLKSPKLLLVLDCPSCPAVAVEGGREGGSTSCLLPTSASSPEVWKAGTDHTALNKTYLLSFTILDTALWGPFSLAASFVQVWLFAHSLCDELKTDPCLQHLFPSLIISCGWQGVLSGNIGRLWFFLPPVEQGN